MAKHGSSKRKTRTRKPHVRPGEDQHIAAQRDTLRRLRLARKLEHQLTVESARLSRSIKRTCESMNTIANALADRGIYTDSSPLDRLEQLADSITGVRDRVSALEARDREVQS